MLRAAAAPSEKVLAETSASGTVLSEQTGWRVNEGWLSTALLILMVLSTIWSIHTASWADGTQVMFALALAGIAVGLVVSQKTWAGWRAVLFGFLVGSLLCYAVIGEIFPEPRDWPGDFSSLVTETSKWIRAGETREGLPPPVVSLKGVAQQTTDFAVRIATWSELAWYGRPSTDNGIFLLLMALLAWGLGYIGAWGLFRLNDIVVASLPTGIALVTNASYSAQAQTPFVIFIISLLLLAVSINLYALRNRWERFSVDYPAALLFDILATSLAVIVVLAVVSMFGPRVVNNPLSIAFWRYVGEQWTQLENTSNRLFAGIQGPGIRYSNDGAGGSLVLGGPINLSPRRIMSVYSEEAHYWRGRTYDTYTGRGWRNSDALMVKRTSKQPVSEPTTLIGRRIQTIFEIDASRSTVIYAPVEPVALSINYQRLVPSGDGDINDFSALYSRRPAMPSLTYGAVSLVPEPGVDDLRAASTTYPNWIKDRYLQLPDLPDRVRSLSTSLMRDRETVYDKVVAVERFIRRYQYTLDTPLIPEGRDAVDYFLFDSKLGYCDYFSSSTVILLRLQGIPARVATGFVPGTFNDNTGAYEVIGEDLHSWPEVYFPNFGWISFEPSGYRPGISRPQGSGADSGLGASDDPLDEELEELALLLGLEDVNVGGEGFVTVVESWRARVPNLLPVVLLIVGVLGIYQLIRILWERRLPSREVVRRRYKRMVFLGGFFGRKRGLAETPLEYAEALTREMEISLDQDRNKWLRSVIDLPHNDPECIAAAYVRSQYGQQSPSDSERTEVEKAWRNLWWHLPLLVTRQQPGKVGSNVNVSNDQAAKPEVA